MGAWERPSVRLSARGSVGAWERGRVCVISSTRDPKLAEAWARSLAPN